MRNRKWPASRLGPERGRAAITNIRLHDKLGALKVLARHLQLLVQPTSGGEMVIRWDDAE